jgi:hypothetical protein
MKAAKTQEIIDNLVAAGMPVAEATSKAGGIVNVTGSPLAGADLAQLNALRAMAGMEPVQSVGGITAGYDQNAFQNLITDYNANKPKEVVPAPIVPEVIPGDATNNPTNGELFWNAQNLFNTVPTDFKSLATGNLTNTAEAAKAGALLGQRQTENAVSKVQDLGSKKNLNKLKIKKPLG